jgi:threonine/homoserine/homoserine lactone efflux protein
LTEIKLQSQSGCYLRRNNFGVSALSLPAFALAVFLLLLTPGPTNTLLAISGAARGLKASLPLIGAELGGYLTTILPLVFLAAPMLADEPVAALVIKLASTLWMLMLAARLWNRPPSTSEPGAITVLSVYCTTVLNPKALIVAVALIPAASFASPQALHQPFPYLAVFSLLVVVIAACWLGVGAAILRRVAATSPLLFGRVAASFLVIFAMSLAGGAIGWI